MRLMWLAERPHDLKLTVPSSVFTWQAWHSLPAATVRNFADGPCGMRPFVGPALPWTYGQEPKPGGEGL